MVYQICLVLVFVLMPALVLFLCRKVKWIGKLGPILTLYILGVIIGNIGNIFGVELPESTSGIQNALSTVTVPFAIPLMLLGCTFSKGDGRKYFMVLLTGLVAVMEHIWATVCSVCCLCFLRQLFFLKFVVGK